jgi:hypothetical protein
MVTTRRIFWKESIAAVATVSALSVPPSPVVAAEQEEKLGTEDTTANNKNQTDAKEQKRLAKAQREKEKEEKRIAEDTKKRLAVGRIGQIGAL